MSLSLSSRERTEHLLACLCDCLPCVGERVGHEFTFRVICFSRLPLSSGAHDLDDGECPAFLPRKDQPAASRPMKVRACAPHVNGRKGAGERKGSTNRTMLN